ncbi:MAG: phenylalanine--tRNA ligase subunit beta [Cyanobacteria bacterium P01_H01_bin.15]
MQISLNWLQELVAVDLPAETLAQTLTIAGFEVEGIEDLRSQASGVVVGRVLERQPHPNADKLSVCQVDVGQAEPSTIVCGAKNVRAESWVPVATPGSYLPAIDLKIKPAKLRGVRSEGMICSLAELGLVKSAEGIHLFPARELVPGQPVAPLLGLDDTVLDVTSTANRADALSMVGIAREVGALTGAEVSLPQSGGLTSENTDEYSVSVENATECPAYFGVLITGVKIQASPDWLQWRLQAAGVRPINNVVDVTNLVLLEWGQPLHAFDAQKLQKVAGSEPTAIFVRHARTGEKLTTLDEQTRELEPENLLITAGEQPVALAGVMGGQETEVSDETQDLFLEVALFDPVAVRRSSRAQGMRTEASTRYERGVNQAEIELAVQRAVDLIVELAGGQVEGEAVHDARKDVYPQAASIELRLARVQQILGDVEIEGQRRSLARADIEGVLTALSCQLTVLEDNPLRWQVQVPPYRYRDLEREIDLVEEVARLFGFDKFVDTLPMQTPAGFLPDWYQAQQRIRRACRAVGLTELVHYSLVKPEDADIAITNPLLAEYSALRRELRTGLVEAFARNLSHSNQALNGFEIGRVFWRNEQGEMAEADKLGGIFGGEWFLSGRWSRGGQDNPTDWYQAKGLLEDLWTSLGLTVDFRRAELASDEAFWHPGRTAALWLGETPVGLFGQLHPVCRQTWDLPSAVYLFELDVAPLVAAITAESVGKFQTFSTYPAVARDLAFFVPVATSVSDLTAAMMKAGGKLLQSVELFDDYRGTGVPDGERSLAFSLVYQARDRTLTDEDVEPVHEKIRKVLIKNFGVTLRS